MSKKDNTISDFITLFNAFWYRDFPLSQAYKKLGSRAEWTTHIGSCVKSCAEMLGYFTYFESGIRTDAVIKDNVGNDIAHIEWEWWEPHTKKVNEIKKLFSEKSRAKFSVLFSYSRQNDGKNTHVKNIKSIQKQWGNGPYPLVVFLITFNYESSTRWFNELETYLVKDGKMKKVRNQPALPWCKTGTRWEVS
ncbi:MAG: hypothetical protein KA473_08295 [Anaerolineales bacterium]|nr:hypothetical protein [Anaerolineales bacterium]MBP6209429.1 hypothetical protein [Anaerolineales bacterium]